jgi:hypothetical protein
MGLFAIKLRMISVRSYLLTETHRGECYEFLLLDICLFLTKF